MGTRGGDGGGIGVRTGQVVRITLIGMKTAWVPANACVNAAD
jgi:hypothetical protein